MMAAIAAEKKTFSLTVGKVQIEIPELWQEVTGLFGVQLSLLGPKKNSHRPVVMIDATDFSKYKFDKVALKKNEREYRTGKEEWLAKMKGKSISYFPYEVQNRSKDQVIHQVGLQYEIDGKKFVEKSYYVHCGQNLFHLKSLNLLEDDKDYKDDIEKIVSTFSCE